MSIVYNIILPAYIYIFTWPAHSLPVSLQYTGYTIFYHNAENFLLLPSAGRPLWQGVVVWGLVGARGLIHVSRVTHQMGGGVKRPLPRDILTFMVH